MAMVAQNDATAIESLLSGLVHALGTSDCEVAYLSLPN